MSWPRLRYQSPRQREGPGRCSDTQGPRATPAARGVGAGASPALARPSRGRRAGRSAPAEGGPTARARPPLPPLHRVATARASQRQAARAGTIRGVYGPCPPPVWCMCGAVRPACAVPSTAPHTVWGHRRAEKRRVRLPRAPPRHARAPRGACPARPAVPAPRQPCPPCPTHARRRPRARGQAGRHGAPGCAAGREASPSGPAAGQARAPSGPAPSTPARSRLGGAQGATAATRGTTRGAPPRAGWRAARPGAGERPPARDDTARADHAPCPGRRSAGQGQGGAAPQRNPPLA